MRLQHEKQTRVYLFCEWGHHWVLRLHDHSGSLQLTVKPLEVRYDD